MTLSEEEKREVRGTDPRAAALLDEVDHMPDELWDRLHGTVRYLDSMTAAGPLAPPPEPAAPLDVPWWDPGADASVDPEHDAVHDRRRSTCAGAPASCSGPASAGRRATTSSWPGAPRPWPRCCTTSTAATHLAVTVDDDPGADLKTAHGRYLYFAPDEVEPIRCRRRRPS